MAPIITSLASIVKQFGIGGLAAGPSAFSQTLTYSYTGSDQSLTIPAAQNITSAIIYAWGSGGGGYSGYNGGGGGFSQATIPVSPGQSFVIVVGEGGGGFGAGQGGTNGSYGGGGGSSYTGGHPNHLTSDTTNTSASGSSVANSGSPLYTPGVGGGGSNGQPGYVVITLSGTSYI